MIIRENIVDVEEYNIEKILEGKEVKYKPEEIIFFDLEHYVYKKPKCIGVFGACIYDNKDKKIHVTQYMIENKGELVEILILAKKYFIKMKRLGKKVIVTFSGNNDFTVIKYLFNKYFIYFDFDKEFKSLDIQKEYERNMNTSIGLKNLEKFFSIYREGDVISGSNLAKTFHKVLKDKEYIERMPKEKIETILLYNEQDVVNLYKIFVTWKDYIKSKDDVIKVNEDKEDIIKIEDNKEFVEDIKEDLNNNTELLKEQENEVKSEINEDKNTDDCIID
ncbi:ribonuclease H-like domain-containing protein [uncultured Clostridium sp.]|uniref:ribonuclease H-like domain-containing protein n=1 Tax=uncultured Clostridium sp. TaxID=59620 RepID=UPI00272DB666|nr:ribonuclease H-like domain-containing protein [uncultured Clostridium sp.]